MENTIASLASLIPADVELMTMLKFIGIFAVSALALGLISGMLLGRRSGLNHALCSAIGILFVYALSIVIYSFNPGDLAKYLTPLPFISFEGEKLYIFSFAGATFPVLCTEVLSIVILAFIANLLDHVMPTGKTVFSWFLLRILTVVIAFFIHGLTSKVLESYLPGVLVTYAPMILLCLLLFMLFLGLLKGILTLFLVTINPVIAAISAFFFSNVIGTNLGKAVLTAGMISGIAYALVHFGFAVISISAAALTSYIPLIIALVLLWYFIDRVL